MTSMSEQIEKEVNTVAWTQIPATDIAQATHFYNQVFGWICQDLTAEHAFADPEEKKKAFETFNLKPEDVVFSLIRFSEKDPVPHGGFMKVQPGNLLSPALHPDNGKKHRLSVCSTITVRSIDETLPLIVEAGGEVYEGKTLLPGGMGATALFLDTEKNVMGLWSEK